MMRKRTVKLMIACDNREIFKRIQRKSAVILSMAGCYSL